MFTSIVDQTNYFIDYLIKLAYRKNRKRIELLILLVSCSALIALIFKPSLLTQFTEAQTTLGAETSETAQTYLVTRVLDGDTIELENGKKVRYIGIDSPEKGDCYDQQATDANSDLVLNKQVRLEKDVSETDRYGRLLRYVYVGTVFVNDELVKRGFAQTSSFPPDIQHQELFRESERLARLGQQGLWSTQCE